MVFEITPENIEALSDVDLRILVGRLAEQEVIRVGYSSSGVTYGGHQYAKDGGIDVRVDLGHKEISNYVPRSQTGFQVKAEDMPKSAILSEMKGNGVLRASIVDLAEAGGAYIIVSSKGSVADTSLKNRKSTMAEALADTPSAANLYVDFYDRRRLASWVNQHPGLIPWVRSRVGLPLAGWRPYEDWSSSPGATDECYFTDDHVRLVGKHFKDTGGIDAVGGINQLRKLLSIPKGAVRLVGLSGVGKTRLAQVLFDKTIGENALDSSLAIYADLADGPDPVPLELLSRIQNLEQKCILVVDNCGIELHRKLVARMKNVQTDISILTIEYDISDDEPESTDVFKLEPASSTIIEKIVERRYPNLSGPEIRTIAEFSEGNSRVALALAEASKEGESIANLQDSTLIKKLFHQNQEENPKLLRAARVCALVYSFDGETLEGEEAELPILAVLAEQSISEMHAHIAELCRRQLVQKRSKWRALLPHALAHKLAKQALQDIPLKILKSKFIDVAPERMFKSFSRRLGCLHDSPEAQAIVEGWLADGGRLSEIEKLDCAGMIILKNLAPINPDAVLKSIQVTVQRTDALFDTKYSHRSEIISLLRSLAYEEKSFDEAATLIAAFTGDGSKSNNMGDAVNVFKSLFYIYLSGTHASAEQRAKFLKSLAQSQYKNSHKQVMSALDAMLECSHFSSHYGFEFGGRKRNYGLYPKGKEVTHWYRTVFALAGDLADLPAFCEPVRKMVAAQFRFLAPRTGCLDDLIALADRFAADGGWPEGWAGVRASVRLAKKEKQKNEAEKLEALAGRIQPESLSDRISTYVLPEQWGALDIAEADFDDEKRYEKVQRHVEATCAEIGKELANDVKTLALHLPVLLKSKSTRVATVARSIGRETSAARDVWNTIIAGILCPKNERPTSGLISFFLVGLAEKDKGLVDILLDEAFENTALHPFFVRMQSLVDVDRRGWERLIQAANSETVPIHSFHMLSIGRCCDDIVGPDFKRLILAIGEREDGLDVALEVLRMRYWSRKNDQLPLDKDEKDTGRALLNLVTFEERNRRETRELEELVRKCLTSPADDELAQQLCIRLLERVEQYRLYAGDYGKLVTELAAIFPRVVLDIFIERAAEEREGRRNIFSSFREHGRNCPFYKIPDEILLEWAHEKPETRFLQLSETIRPWRKRDAGSNDNADDETGPLQWTNAAVRILHEAPEPLEILSQYIESFRPSGWSGSLADILESRLSLIERLTQDSEPAIVEAARAEIEAFKKEIESTREWESHRDRERDERFEW